MSKVPCTLIVISEDPFSLPTEAAFVTMKAVFQYGVKQISQKDDKILVSLSYSPKKSTLKKKIGNLPIKYFRTKLESEEELLILGKCLEQYSFNMEGETIEPPKKRTRVGHKIVLESRYKPNMSLRQFFNSEKRSRFNF